MQNAGRRDQPGQQVSEPSEDFIAHVHAVLCTNHGLPWNFAEKLSPDELCRHASMKYNSPAAETSNVVPFRKEMAGLQQGA